MNTIQTAATERSFEQIVTDYDMLRRAKAIREWLSELSGLIPRLNEGPNPYYNATVDGLTLVHYYGGPSLLGTPFGGWAATGGGCLRDNNWFDKAQDRLGLEVLMPEYQNRQGCYGPIHAITKDLDGEPLPKVDWRFSGIGIGIVSQSAFGTNFHDIQSLKDWILREGVVDDLSGYFPQFNFPADWMPDHIHGHLAYALNRHLWDRKVKPAIGFRDWQDEKKEQA